MENNKQKKDIKYKGLTKEKAKKLFRKYGPNELKRKKKIKPIKIFIEQFTSPLLILLIVSAIILGVMNYFNSSNNFLDSILILIIVFISGISGFIQNYKAEKSIEALQKMSVSKTKVLREGVINLILTSEVVPGDVLILEAGDLVPADAKLIVANFIQVNESPLTGESKAVDKKVGNQIYMNTYILSGNAVAKVYATGMKTKVGKIAHKLEDIKEEKTPFYTQINKLSKKLFWIVLIIAILLGVVGLFRYSLTNSILISISLAVAAIPEGLHAVLVLSLVVGSRVILRNHALVRKLSVVESIGAVNYICTDKTGTITEGKMSVTEIYANRKELNIESIDNSSNLKKLFLCNVLNNNSKQVYDKKLKIVGDETEIALLNFGLKFNYDNKKLNPEFKRIMELPFDAKRKMMSVVVSTKNKKQFVYTKGAPEKIIDRCNWILVNGKILELTSKEKKKIIKVNNKFASKGLRVLGFAYKDGKVFNRNDGSIEKDLIFIGLEGIIDPPRKGVKSSIAQCKTAGINVLMLTGDNPLTAKAISSQVGIVSEGILTGKEIRNLSNVVLYSKILKGYKIFARLTPEDKLRIMSILQKNQKIVAMTGDGVNDALALKKADIGISMGIRGTDVAKQASDLILLDDNFITIVSAIKQGRRIFDNIRKFVNYLFTCNLAEVGILLLATSFLTLKVPILLPVQLLWINLLTDGFPALALGIDPVR